ncbi:hypothetical protein LDC_0393, partial [sediment metagenome]
QAAPVLVTQHGMPLELSDSVLDSVKPQSAEVMDEARSLMIDQYGFDVQEVMTLLLLAAQAEEIRKMPETVKDAVFFCVTPNGVGRVLRFVASLLEVAEAELAAKQAA